MSEASRGVQAPNRPDDATDLDTGAEPAHSAGTDDDFYATVNNAAASRSTRINHPDGDGQAPTGPAQPDRGPDYSRAAMPWDTDSSGDKTGDDAAEPDGGAKADGAAGAGAPDDVADTSSEQAPKHDGGRPATEGKSWRDRWNGLTGSITGKRAESAAPPADSAAAAETATAATAAEGTGSGESGSAQPATASSARVGTSAATSAAAVAAPAAGAGALAARPGEQLGTPKPKPKLGAPHRTRKARLRLSRIDPWSVMKTSFLFSIAAGIVLVVAVYVIWTVIGSSGLFSSVNDIVSSVVSTPGDTTPFRIEEYVNTQKVMGVTALVAVIDVLIFTALATLTSFLYNLASTMLGGLEVTLAED